MDPSSQVRAPAATVSVRGHGPSRGSRGLRTWSRPWPPSSCVLHPARRRLEFPQRRRRFVSVPGCGEFLFVGGVCLVFFPSRLHSHCVPVTALPGQDSVTGGHFAFCEPQSVRVPGTGVGETRGVASEAPEAYGYLLWGLLVWELKFLQCNRGRLRVWLGAVVGGHLPQASSASPASS